MKLPSPRHLRTTVASAFAVVGVITLAATTALTLYERAQTAHDTNDAAARRLATQTADELARAFGEWQNELLVAADNDSMRRYYTTRRDRAEILDSINASLVGLHALYPDLIDEACFIDARGPELARQIDGERAAPADLSPDETGSPFFAATMSLGPGQVHQHTPYLSPDSHSWVVSSSTPIAVERRTVAVLHFEAELDPLRRRVARLLPRGARARVVDVAGRVTVFQTDVAVPAVDPDSPLAEQPLPRTGAWAALPGTVPASADVPFGPTNANRWRVELQMPATASISAGAVSRLVAMSVLLLVAVAVTGLVLARLLVRPVAAVTAHAERVAAGDLTGRVELRRRDELGRLAAAVNQATESLARTVRRIAAADDALVGVSRELASRSDELAAGAARASDVAESAVRHSGEVDDGVQTLSTGAEQLGRSVTQIAANAQQAAEVARESVRAVGRAVEEISVLDTASAEIGGVVELITSIAEQTNLLALNATIEAARAGVAGRGFAVVADEVKQLAGETSRATGDITARIGALQAGTRSAAGAVDALGRIIAEMSRFNQGIAEAAEEQSTTTHDMGRAIRAAAAGSSALSERIGAVAQINERTAGGATTSLRTAEQVEAVADDLTRIVRSFRVDPG